MSHQIAGPNLFLRTKNTEQQKIGFKAVENLTDSEKGGGGERRAGRGGVQKNRETERFPRPLESPCL